MQLNNRIINILIAIGAVVVLAIVTVALFASVNNSVVALEETISSNKSNISKEEKRRVDLFNNLVSAVESYNKFEQSTLEKLVAARSAANAGKITSAQQTLAAVVEAYPQLKSQDNYKQAMLEFSITENRIAQYRENYNTNVRDYNKSVRSFPKNVILAISGYEKRDYKYLEFSVDNSEAQKVFNKSK